MKRIFFAALLATVAVGGAFKANAINLYAPGSSDAVPCEITESVSCSLVLGSTTAFERPANDPNGQGNPVDATDYTYAP